MSGYTHNYYEVGPGGNLNSDQLELYAEVQRRAAAHPSGDCAVVLAEMNLPAADRHAIEDALAGAMVFPC